jgi:hypothetical protein
LEDESLLSTKADHPPFPNLVELCADPIAGFRKIDDWRVYPKTGKNKESYQSWVHFYPPDSMLSSAAMQSSRF